MVVFNVTDFDFPGGGRSRAPTVDGKQKTDSSSPRGSSSEVEPLRTSSPKESSDEHDHPNPPPPRVPPPQPPSGGDADDNLDDSSTPPSETGVAISPGSLTENPGNDNRYVLYL